MKRGILIGSVLLGVALRCGAADWPRWRGPEGSGHVAAGQAVPDSLPDQPKVLWRVKVGNGFASPVVCGGKVFHLDNQQSKETAHALEAATGKELWNVAFDEAFKDFQSVSGPRCTPVADGDRVYVQSCRGEFQCLAAADGKRIWGVNFVKDFDALFFGEQGPAVGASRHGNTGCAVVDGDRIIVNVGGRPGASLVCFDKLTGKVVWKSGDDVPGYSGPVLATIAGVKQVVSFTSNAVTGLDAANGSPLWREPVKTGLGRHVMTPVIVGDMVMVASHQAGLVGVKVAKEGDAFKAQRAWVDRGSAVNFLSPVAAGGHLYGLAPATTMFCIDVRTGEKAWAEKGLFQGMVSKGYAGLLVLKDKVLVLAEAGQLVLVAADPKGCRVIGKVKVCGPNWCNPAYADGKLYLRDDKELLCVDLMP